MASRAAVSNRQNHHHREVQPDEVQPDEVTFPLTSVMNC